MRDKTRDTDVVLRRLAVAITGLGLILLLVKILSVVFVRLNGGGPFGTGFLDSSADSHRFIAYVGLIIVGGLLYGLGSLGKVLSEVVAAIVIWQIYTWYTDYQSYTPLSNFWQYLDAGVFLLMSVVTVGIALYIPYHLWFSPDHRLGSPRPAR